jgi:LPS-assembly lipoprotein
LSPNLKRALSLLALSFLAGCGFTPLYGGGGDDSVAAQLEQIRVQNIPERQGQVLHDTLQDDLQRDGAPVTQLYTLSVSYNVDQQSIGIQQDTSSTRTRFVVTADWALAPIGQPDSPLVKGKASTEDAENTIDNQYFASELEGDTINQQLADEIAAQITSQVAVYFKTHPQG